MYCHIEGFTKAWAQERENTLKMLRVLTDASLDQRIDPDGRSLRELAWHIIVSQGEMLERTGLSISAPPENALAPERAREILDAYERSSASVSDQIQASWTDADLETEVNMYGEYWKKSMILSVLVIHEVHHRAQMTVLMRQAGLRVPGIYGPSREEWAELGMPVPA